MHAYTFKVSFTSTYPRLQVMPVSYEVTINTTYGQAMAEQLVSNHLTSCFRGVGLIKWTYKLVDYVKDAE